MNKHKLFSSASSTWDTPEDLYEILNEEFTFNIDVASQDYSAKCPIYYTPDVDGLSQKWRGVCWMNPPYGREISKWVKKAYEEHLEGATVVCLLPARVDTKWFHDYCTKGEVRLIKGRLKFDNRSLPSWREDGSHKRSAAPFPSMVVVFSKEVTPSIKTWDFRDGQQ